MYKVEFLPISQKDLVDIARYIAVELQNPIAAKNLTVAFEATVNRLCEFPYANPVHTPIRPLKREYRKIFIKNYVLLYSVEENTKTVTVARVIYAKSAYQQLPL